MKTNHNTFIKVNRQKGYMEEYSIVNGNRIHVRKIDAFPTTQNCIAKGCDGMVWRAGIQGSNNGYGKFELCQKCATEIQ